MGIVHYLVDEMTGHYMEIGKPGEMDQYATAIVEFLKVHGDSTNVFDEEFSLMKKYLEDGIRVDPHDLVKRHVDERVEVDHRTIKHLQEENRDLRNQITRIVETLQKYKRIIHRLKDTLDDVR